MHFSFNLSRFPALVAAFLAPSLAVPASAQTKKPKAPTPYLHAPSVDRYAEFNPEGRTIMTTGRYLRPVGSHVPVGRWPTGLTLSPDGKTAFVASDGVGQIITNWQSGTPTPRPFTGVAENLARFMSSTSSPTAF